MNSVCPCRSSSLLRSSVVVSRVGVDQDALRSITEGGNTVCNVVLVDTPCRISVSPRFSTTIGGELAKIKGRGVNISTLRINRRVVNGGKENATGSLPGVLITVQGSRENGKLYEIVLKDFNILQFCRDGIDNDVTHSLTIGHRDLSGRPLRDTVDRNRVNESTVALRGNVSKTINFNGDKTGFFSCISHCSGSL